MSSIQHFQVIQVYRHAPSKPPLGDPCNGCGICCLSEPCPLAHLLFRQTQGACKAVQWQPEQLRYTCGLLSDPDTFIPKLPWLPLRFKRWLIQRWIAAGKGCDSPVRPQDSV